MKVKTGEEIRDIKTLWREGQIICMIDQRKLPHKFEVMAIHHHKEMAEAITNMVLRGAGAIGVAGAYGIAQAAMEAEILPENNFEEYINAAAERLRRTRPTAVNLFHSIDRCLQTASYGPVRDRIRRVVAEADIIAEEDLSASRKIGEYGSALIDDGSRILTHCNAGALAFIDFGTALSPIRLAHSRGMRLFVFIDETRPRCQGSRLTAWELQQEEIPYAVIVDNAAGYFLRKGEIDMIIVGADRIASNGDVANKIGTYEKAVLAHENGIPFYVAAPTTTFDLHCEKGDDIEIEERSGEEVTGMWGVDEDGIPTKIRITAKGTPIRNPAFDITPSQYVTSFITERGIIRPPYPETIRKVFSPTL